MPQATHIPIAKKHDGAVGAARSVIKPEHAFVDRRQATVAQRQLGDLIAQSQRMVTQRAQMAMIRGETVQRQEAEKEISSQAKCDAAACEIPVQARAEPAPNRIGVQANSSVIQKVKTDHTAGDLHYGIHAARMAGYGAMPSVGVHPLATNPITVDNLNALSGITAAFKRGDGDYMRGYFDVLAMLNAHVNGAVADKPGRWLDFLKTRISYLSIDKHIAQIQMAGATAVDPTKDRLNKNGKAPDATIGETNKGKQNAIVAAHTNGKLAAAHVKYKEHVSAWVWDVFFRRTSKLGIDFTISEARVIHMNTYGPAWSGGAATLLTDAAGTSGHSRQPITHSEMRHINRTYGANHAQIDAYNMPIGGGIGRAAGEGEMLSYLNTRTQNTFLSAVLEKTNLDGWRTRADSMFLSRPSGVSTIRKEINSGHPGNTKLENIRATAHAKTGPAKGRHADTITFYSLLDNIPINVSVYNQAGTAQAVNDVITNSLQPLTHQIIGFTLP
ncbi:hypothetical protein [Janthinobacterium fluminis]|uniref:Uncharacterized protein n=1 Tax=Janthinobacterium fluminis TaxID=2987524 RepID=A0ABT5JWZ6_9BURK|nr:hypothetical protein [Janthinobacterium fluminis]MDC8756945.1 hypothetical protein [Janthinobacterium fluminis]